MTEREIQAKVFRMLGGREDCRLFRNAVGFDEVKLIHYGLCPGSSDLIGWRTVIVTPEMVGSKLAVFLAVECKSLSGHVSEKQKIFIETVQKAGGIAGMVRSVEEAGELVSGEREEEKKWTIITGRP